MPDGVVEEQVDEEVVEADEVEVEVEAVDEEVVVVDEEERVHVRLNDLESLGESRILSRDGTGCTLIACIHHNALNRL